ncbi:Cytochrome c oxidase subunit III [Candidatus Ornithobacterium hominis]|uniref:cbb3-type cytochrome c oxidase N-terminal domain-containing protein n=1 Tax=Candidatus Ornithobacterium hominis TaxID=2497989 RepID=UPI0024BC0C75|nr:cbb3-type cytochrome c oxidase N-terminal domain-containing protein [Candidatus Ornithobacterium hominis]CAI9428776.1 Cytochrome c oxidase subunit III [Candidatus Ornithobacterium hominis]
MKHRIPGSVFIPVVMLVILAAFMTVTPVNFIPEHGLLGIFYNAYYQIINVLSNWVVWVILILSFLMLLVVDYMNKVIERKKFEQLSPEEQAIYVEEKKAGFFKTWFRSGREKQTEEEEQAILLDHGFDGIKELDNSLPQWWLALFYLGCIYMVIYIVAYFTTDFAHPIEEFNVETAMLQEQADEWIKSNDITIAEAENFYQDEAAIERGKVIYENICATCHTKSGGGSVGPNLTDDYWINHTEDDLFKNIYKVIYDGSPNNPAMQAFGQTKQLTGLDVQDVSSYVYSLNQVQQEVTQADGGLEPQGDEISKWKRK